MSASPWLPETAAPFPFENTPLLRWPPLLYLTMEDELRRNSPLAPLARANSLDNRAPSAPIVRPTIDSLSTLRTCAPGSALLFMFAPGGRRRGARWYDARCGTTGGKGLSSESAPPPLDENADWSSCGQSARGISFCWLGGFMLSSGHAHASADIWILGCLVFCCISLENNCVREASTNEVSSAAWLGLAAACQGHYQNRSVLRKSSLQEIYVRDE